MAEMRRVVEAPVQGDFGDTLAANARVGQFLQATLQALSANPIVHRRSPSREKPVQMAHRNARRGRNLCWAQRGFRQMLVDVIEDLGERDGRRPGFALSVPRTTDASRQDAEICVDRRSTFLFGELSRLLIK